MENLADKYTHINGWGIDADPKNDPTYPMKQRTNEEHQGYSWVRPTQQPVNIEVLHSNERPNVTAVFGTSVPPSGLSGMIRRFAFRYSENSYLHWLPLLLADRVNVVEGVVEDLLQGQVPNTFAEKGGAAQWSYNRTGLLTKVAVGAALAAGLVAVLYTRDNSSRTGS